MTDATTDRTTTDRTTTGPPDRCRTAGTSTPPAGGAIYALGIFGAWVYFWQQAETFWAYVLVIFQGIFWPAWMVYEVFEALNR